MSEKLCSIILIIAVGLNFFLFLFFAAIALLESISPFNTHADYAFLLVSLLVFLAFGPIILLIYTSQQK